MREARNGEEFVLFESGDDVISQKKGHFDGWMIMENNRWLRDRTYFDYLLTLAQRYTSEMVYNDFMSVAELVPNEFNNQQNTGVHSDSVDAIRMIAGEHYPDDQEFAFKAFIELYATMVAEEMKENTRLGRRIKMLAVHQLLILGMPLEEVTEYSKGKKATELDRLCTEYGF